MAPELIESGAPPGAESQALAGSAGPEARPLGDSSAKLSRAKPAKSPPTSAKKQSSRLRNTLIVIAVVIAAALAAGLYWWLERDRGVLDLPGVVEIQEVRVGSKVGGRVAEVRAVEGGKVTAGQVLVRLECPELLAHREQLRSELRSAESALEKARNGSRPEEVDAAAAAARAAAARVKRIRAGWREEEVRQAKAELDTAEADLKLARDEFDRANRLYPQRSISKAEFDVARAARNRAEGRYSAAKAVVDKMYVGSRPEDIEEAEAELARTEANYRLLKAGTRKEDIQAAEAAVSETRAKLAELEANLAECEIRAPEPAIVEVVNVRKGDLVGPNQSVLRLLRAGDWWIKVFVPETELGKLRLNQEVEVRIDSFPDRHFAGRITQLASISEFTPRNVQSVDERRHQVFAVKVTVDDPAGVFKAGMAADVRLPLHEDTRAATRSSR